MDPAVTTKRAPPPGRLGSRITQTPDAYVIGHFGIARVAGPDWSLRVDGLVGNVLRISLPQLRALPSVTVTAVLECFGNPLQPTTPVRRAANGRSRGVPVRALLDAAGARSRASSVWARGLDSGQFDGIDCACYLKDLPLATVAERGIIAYERRGLQLAAVLRRPPLRTRRLPHPGPGHRLPRSRPAASQRPQPDPLGVTASARQRLIWGAEEQHEHCSDRSERVYRHIKDVGAGEPA